MRNIIKQEITERSKRGYLLASKFPELKGLSWEEFLLKLPVDLDFITANQMFEALNTKVRSKKE